MKKILLLTATVLISCMSLSALTNIPGGAVSGTWDLSGSPYIIGGNIYVAAGKTLNIEEGVRVLFDGHYYLDVQGSILAIGTANDYILFSTTDEVDIWNGIRFDYTDNEYYSRLSYCEIEYSVKNAGTSCGEPESSGGAIYVRDFFNLDIKNCIIHDNEAWGYGGPYGGIYGQGGAIAIYSSYSTSNPLTIDNCLIYDNYAACSGGGIAIMNGSNPIITDNSIDNNHSTQKYGGGIAIGLLGGNPSNPEIRGNQIYSNSSYMRGGGVYICESSPVFEENDISSNSTDENGGGVYLREVEDLEMTENIISSNEAEEDGGGIYIYNGENIELENNTISENEAGENGGGIYLTSVSNIDVNLNEINANYAVTDGGGVYLENSGGNLLNNLFVENTATDGAGVFSLLQQSIALNINHNTIADNVIINNGPCGGLYSNSSDVHHPNIYNNIFTDNDGANVTIINPNGSVLPSSTNCNGCQAGFVNGYHLSSSSPCVDAGSNTPAMTTFDLDGNERILNYITDKGAYEYVASKSEGVNASTGEYTGDIVLYPNPASESVEVKLDLKETTVEELTVYNALGKVVMNILVPDHTSYYNVDVSVLSTGLYFVCAKTRNNHFVSKLTIK